jgi:lipopolysaccharide export system permease protein
MKLIDRYIITKCFMPFLYCISAFTVLFVIVDLFESLDTIIKNQVNVIKILQYYYYLIPSFMIQVCPLALLLASVYILGKLAHDNELNAMRATGINLFRIIMPFLFLGFILSLLIVLLNETITPIYAFKSVLIKEKYITKDSVDKDFSRNNIAVISNKHSYFIKKYDIENKEMFGITILQYNKDDEVIARIDAERGKWTGIGWRFFSGNIREFVHKTQTNMTGFGEKFIRLPEKPESFAKKFDLNLMSSKEIRDYIQSLIKKGAVPTKELVGLYNKLAMAFASFVLLFIGIPIILIITHTGLLTGIMLSIVVSFIYKLVIVVGVSLGHGEVLSPVLSAWFANIIFLITGSVLLNRVKV